MLGRAAIAGLALASLGVAAVFAQAEGGPSAAEASDTLVRERGIAAGSITSVTCTRRTSALYGERTYHCEATLARAAGPETLSFVLTAFDGRWVLADR